ncbi:MAG TPA: response regulator transcription factor [Longimicrobiales bacterium]|nr:response regulator transcription factor [Longimicrobiales bacterium]
MRILIVEDDRKVASFVARGLREEGWTADVAHDGEDGLLKAAVHPYDVIVLDVMLPERSGFEVVRELRSRDIAIPVLMLTARDTSEDVVTGLDAGADDYLTKPFAFDELLARLRALLRRGGRERMDRLTYADLDMDLIRHRITRAGDPLDLTPLEFRLLEYFMRNAERVVRRTELLEKVWDLSFDPMSNVVDVHVRRLRQKLREGNRSPLIQTVRGVGYVLHEDGET